jgi:hypothetical protein
MKSAEWYCEKFNADIIYADASWSVVQLDNIKLAFVVKNQHPAHIAFRIRKIDPNTKTKPHRDGTESYYTRDIDGNIIEMIKYPESTNE